MDREIKVLIVEDSPVARELLIRVLSAEPDISVVGVADDGHEAVTAVQRLKPDIITMDINMPRLDGYSATRQIMSAQPTPIIIVTGTLLADNVSQMFKAVEAGALAVLQRPPGLNHPDHMKAAAELISSIRLMSEIKVVTRPLRNAGVEPGKKAATVPPGTCGKGIRLVAMGASTGGPIALQRILSGLPDDFSLPVVIVQHIAPGFIAGFIDWLRTTCRLPVNLGAHGTTVLPGNIYVAPESAHLGVDSSLRLYLCNHPPENGVRPSVSFLFRSVAAALGSDAIGILLTGMGRDGALELKTMRERGALTIAQDEGSSIVFGMPGEAVKLDAAINVLPPAEIAAFLTKIDATLKNGGEQR